MNKEWYIQIGEEREGPYTIDDLRKDRRITPETLVWKEGFPIWVPIGKVKELQQIFKDTEAPPRPTEELIPSIPAKISPDGLVLDLRVDPPHPILWLILIVLLILYILYRLF